MFVFFSFLFLSVCFVFLSFFRRPTKKVGPSFICLLRLLRFRCGEVIQRWLLLDRDSRGRFGYSLASNLRRQRESKDWPFLFFEKKSSCVARLCLVISRQRRESLRHFPSIIKWPTLLATELGDLTSRSLSRAKASPTTLDDESRAVDTCPAVSLCVKTAHLINRYNTKRMASSSVVWAHTHVPTVGIKETAVKKRKKGNVTMATDPT
jgi:hypothetical protein